MERAATYGVAGTARVPRAVVRAVAALVAVVVVLVLLPAQASAHATLLRSSPGDESTAKGPITKVELAFDERVAVTFGGTKVWGPDGTRVDPGTGGGDGKTIDIPIDGRAPGTYAVSYRVTSADGHPVHGALTFSVGRRSDSAASERKARAAAAGDRATEVAYGAVRGIALAAMLLVAGGVIFGSVIAPGNRVRGLVPAMWVALLLLPASYVLDAANAGGFSIGEALRVAVLRGEAGTTWGRSVLVQEGLLLVLAVVLRVADLSHVRGRRATAAFVVVPAIAPLLAWSAGGHAVATEPVWLRLPLDMLHLVAAGVWIGGLVQLLAYLRVGAVSYEHVQRWSRTALVAVVVLTATGAYAAWTEIGLSRAAALDTTYGRLVLAKVVLLAGVLPLAWVNRRTNVPQLRGTRSDVAAGRRRLRLYVLGELAVLAFVIAATAALIQTAPARTQVAPDLVDTDIELPSGASVQLVIDPARAGRNAIHAYAHTKADRIDAEVTELELKADGPRGIDDLAIELLPSGPGHYTTPAATIPFAGSWTFSAVVGRGDFESEQGQATVKIGEHE